MAAPALKYAIGNAASTTVSVAVANTDTSAILTSDTNFAAKSGAGMVLFDEGTATEEIAYSTTKAGAALTIPLANRGLEGGAAQAHASGSAIKGVLTAGMWNDLIDSLTNVLSATTGAVDTTKIVDLSTAQTLTTKTLTSPKIGTAIADTNGNELLKLTATASAVNELTLANGATTASPVISATGEDNVGLDIKMKGTGKMRKPTVVGVQVVDAGTDTATGDGKAFFRVPAELNGMNLTGVAATVYTAGTTGTTDIQLRNKTDSADMLSTKMTIDSTETDTSTAATAAVINTSTDDVVTGDVIAIDVDAVSTTAAKGLYVEMRFELPA
jgi:hypothetical protein